MYLNKAPPDVIESLYYFITGRNFALGHRGISIGYIIESDEAEDQCMSKHTCFHELKLFVHPDLIDGVLLSITKFTDYTNALITGKAHNID